MSFSFSKCVMALCAVSVFAVAGSAAIIPISTNYKAFGAGGSHRFNDYNFIETTYGLSDIPDVATSPGSAFNQDVFQLPSTPKAGVRNTLGSYAVAAALSGQPERPY